MTVFLSAEHWQLRHASVSEKIDFGDAIIREEGMLMYSPWYLNLLSICHEIKENDDREYHMIYKFTGDVRIAELFRIGHH